MKTKSIVYKNFVPQVESIPVIKQNESSVFKYTGYKPQYKWSDDYSETTINNSKPELENTPDQIQFQDPSSINWSKVNGYKNQPIITQSQSTTRPRGKHIFKDPSIQVGEMQGLLDAFADAGISLRITSGTRPGATTKQGNQSWHSQGRALDVTPVAGQTLEDFKDLAEKIRNAPELVKYMRDNGYGILDETTPEALARTGGTGAHWHIGPDKVAIAGLETILKGHKGLKIPILFAKEGTKSKSVVQQLLDTPLKSAVIGNQFQDLDPKILKQYVDIATDFVPVVGDAKELYNIGSDLSKGKIGSALLGTTLFLIPGNIPQILRKAPSNLDNVIKIETLLPERLETGATTRTYLPEKVNNRPIQDAMIDLPIEMGDSKGKGALLDIKENKIILDHKLKEDLYPTAITHEWSHWLDLQSPNLFNIAGTSGFTKVPNVYKDVSGDYFYPIPNNGRLSTEVGPRLTQLLDYGGIKDGSKIHSWDEWEYLMDNYIKDHPINNIKILKDSIYDKFLFTNWAKTNAK